MPTFDQTGADVETFPRLVASADILVELDGEQP